MATEQQILEALKVIIDPDLGRDIVSLGFIKNLEIEGGKVRFDVELTTPACPVKERFREQAIEAVQVLDGVDEVHVNMTAQKRKKQELKTDTLENVDAVIVVSSCKGGVGKSTVAAHLARAIQREGHSVGLLDADIHGPSVPTLFQVHLPKMYMDGELLEPVEVDGLKTMSLGYMLGEKPAVMRGPMVANYVMQILRQTKWGTLDYLIIDLPPGTGDIQLTITQQVAIDGAIIVTTPQTLSLVDVSRGILMFETVNVPVLGLVENMSYFICDGCDKKHFLFGHSAETLRERFGLTTLAELPVTPGVSYTAKKENGADIAAFAELAENLHREVGKRRAGGVEQPVVTAEDGHIHIAWPDGSESRLANKQLRISCPCALCVNEFTGEKMLEDASVPNDIQAEEVQTLGHYAVAITWSDGHSSGIFSWEHLRRVAGLA